MPFANEHAARVRAPSGFAADSFRRTTLPDSDVVIIVGKLTGAAAADDPTVVQAYRFPTDKFTETEARDWLKDNEVDFTLFEPATGEDDSAAASGHNDSTTMQAQSCKTEVEAAADDLPKWQHVATAGDYLGYKFGDQPFSMTTETFEQMVKNFRANPAFQAGPEGAGKADVVAWDFNHASEANEATGTIPLSGTPAQGWVQDLALRQDSAGTAQLWALTRWLPTARKYIQEDQYKWASVSVWLRAIDPVSGEQIGARLMSIAMTNNPFILGLQPLAASNDRDRVHARHWYDAAESPLDAVGKLKDLLGLKETDGVVEVVAELAKIDQWLESGTPPLGIDLNEILSAMRTILNLPALSTGLEVLAEASQIARALMEEQAAAAGIPATPPVPGIDIDEPEVPLTSTNQTEDDMTLLKTLANKLGARDTDNEVIAAVEDAVQLRSQIREHTGAAKDTTEALTAEVIELAQDHLALEALHTAIGTTPADALTRIAELLEKETKLAELEPQLTELQAKVDAEEKVLAAAEVDEVIASYKLPESMKDALVLMREQQPEAFKEKFPALTPEQRNLTQPAPTATPAVPPATPAATPPGAPPVVPPASGEVIDLRQMPGRNNTRRAMNYLQATAPGADKWDHSTLWKQACLFMQRDDVIMDAEANN
jgi:hypothetical protein